ncbi:MAG: Gfo/Idh/MocA family oxidoreductase [Clostridia bacterium]|nr:Gfo/Idh/MocA family oxidoreductase [Clostridia bacterium]
MEKLKLGVIGLGARGGYLVDLFLTMDNVTVTALCDVYEDRVESASARVEASCGKKPFGSTDYRELADRKLCDAVVISTGWEDHVDISVYFMEAGIPVGLEVGGAYSLEDCFRLVRCQEKTRTPFMFLENCCYGRTELMVLNMVRQGVLGDIVHAGGGYMHDLRTEVLFGKENRHYRLKNYIERNCHNYPTHDLGPIGVILDFNYGNRPVALSSMASKAAGLNEYAKEHPEVNPDFKDLAFRQGDVVVTNIMCANGATVTLKLDTTLPRPYSRGFTIQGTKGMYQEDGNYVFIDGKYPEELHWNWSPEWNNALKYAEEYDHPIWKRFLNEGVRGGHGGMDYLIYNEFFEDVLKARPFPIDVYDAAILMAITPLSAASIANGSAPVEIPDFTGGRWKTRKEATDRFA